MIPAPAAVSVTVNALVDPANAPSTLLTDGPVDPNNVSHCTPVFSRTFTHPDTADASGDGKSAYGIRIGTTPGSSSAWDSGKLSSLTSSASFAGPELTPNTTYYWSVRVSDKYGTASVCSADGTF